jgi:hypothetical protein
MTQKQGGRTHPPRIVFIIACSHRKRVSPPRGLQLSSINAEPDDRVREWRKRIKHVEAPSFPAEDLYVGDHWSAARNAYREARRYSSRTELWVLSAGYGLTRGSAFVKPYSATFATGSRDSVWRGPSEGDRTAVLRLWWAALNHQVQLRELACATHVDGVVIVGGAAYVKAIDADLQLLRQDGGVEHISIISAGSRSNDLLLPVDATFRAVVGGAQAALNARLLALLADAAPEHGFKRQRMAEILKRVGPQLPTATRRRGTRMTDDEIAHQVVSLRREQPGISRTQALQEIRQLGMACEQLRFASIWHRTTTP